MSAESEVYSHQRSGAQFFFWFIKHFTNIKLTFPMACDVQHEPPLYAVKEFWPQYQKNEARRVELKNRLNAAEQRAEQAAREADMVKGALDDHKYHSTTWVKPDINWQGVKLADHISKDAADEAS